VQEKLKKYSKGGPGETRAKRGGGEWASNGNVEKKQGTRGRLKRRNKKETVPIRSKGKQKRDSKKKTGYRKKKGERKRNRVLVPWVSLPIKGKLE